ncbi:hypothetical protein VBZ51_09310 [Maribacter sp. HS]|uniref:hypothetical protein n=1 Tax=Maribacter sp. HS TaxID=3110480 RepID=UPI003A8AA3B9
MNKLFSILVLLFISCGTQKNVLESKTIPFELGLEMTARVVKIDSIENYYVINIEDKNKQFRIVSKKSSTKPFKGTKLENGNSYFIKVKQLTDRQPPENENYTIPKPVNYLDIAACRNFENTEICTESGFELATAYNVVGLYVKPL